jgi:hypothetical protein
MLEHRLLRAIYDEERGAYVVDHLRATDGEPLVEYRLVMLGTDGGLEKLWFDEHGEQWSEFFAFDCFDDHAVFETFTAELLRQARVKSERENLDEFLAVIDLVKLHAVECGYAGEDLLEFDGLFEQGTEDAYLLHEFEDDIPRLHHHVERPDDECWRLLVKRAVTPQEATLGWAVIAVHYPDLTSEAEDEAVTCARLARVLDLDHFREEIDARLAIGFIRRFMLTGDRVLDPDYAYVNDTTVFECISVVSHPEEDEAANWEVCVGPRLTALHDEELPLVRQSEQWHARDTDMLSEFLRTVPQPPGMDDQLRSALMDMLGIQDDFDDSSPWSQLDLDEPEA